MSTAHLATDDWSHLCKPLDDADARAMLGAWQADGAKLGFGYFRSGAGVMQTGSATLLWVTPQLLTLDTGGSRLVVLLEKAHFQFGNLGFLTPDFRGIYDVEGLSVFLANNDWLCLFSDRKDFDPSLLARQFGLLPAK
jgi:hypothetical protein